MAEHKYSFQSYNKETMTRVVGRSLPVSTKHCIEITGRIRRKKLSAAKRLLQDVIDMKKPLAFLRFTGDVGHKPGIASGRYPVKACKQVLGLLESCEANAQFKGLNTGNMVIVHANAHLGSRQWHYGRQRRRLMKRTHVEIVLEERGTPKEAKKDMKKEEKTEVKKEPKPDKAAEAKADKQKDMKTEKKSDEKPVIEKKPELKKGQEKPKEKKIDKKPAAEKKPDIEDKKANVEARKETDEADKPDTKEAKDAEVADNDTKKDN